MWIYVSIVTEIYTERVNFIVVLLNLKKVTPKYLRILPSEILTQWVWVRARQTTFLKCSEDPFSVDQPLIWVICLYIVVEQRIYMSVPLTNYPSALFPTSSQKCLNEKSFHVTFDILS